MADAGIVTTVGSRSATVHVEGRGELRCTLRGLLWRDEETGESRPIAVGDRVALLVDGDEGVIESVAPRTSRWARPRIGSGRRQTTQVIAANIDRVLVVAALHDPPFRPGLVDRFLVAAAAEQLPAVLLLNKVDLEGRDAEVPPRAIADEYRAFGIEVLHVSATSGEGLAALGALMSSGISLLVGHSGTGKSSLLNAVSPALRRATGDVTGYHGRGRHTTTAVALLPLEQGGFVVDSPGIREFGIAEVSGPDVARLYPGFFDLPDACRFSDCLHRAEPGCAVRAAVLEGRVPASRHESYLRLLEEVQAARKAW